MLKVGQLIERVMPQGTDYKAQLARGRKPKPRWDDPPIWPPDVFAVAAMLVKHSECYAHRDVRGGIRLGRDHAQRSRRIGNRWSKDMWDRSVRAALTSEWNVLRKAWDVSVSKYTRGRDHLAPWAVSALRLLAYADEACRGVGFGTPTSFARAAESVSFDNHNQTITQLVEKMECCVLPKGRTPMVGCNLRSLSLHLALLPPMFPSLHINTPIRPKTGPRRLGVLLIPFPYVVHDKEFTARSVTKQNWGNLGLRCSWGQKPGPQSLARFIGELIREVTGEGGTADIVILPELALSTAQRREVWKTVRKRGTQLLICGVHRAGRVGPMNLASGYIRAHGDARDSLWWQSKHHRWRIDDWQIDKYGLPLAKGRSWWEDIDVRPRSVITTRFTERATVACLVCEDLARVEPVQPLLRELGPSLLVALLMDGPQLEGRWSAKSATIFADDPGSSVLTLTSLGLIRRSLRFGRKDLGSARGDKNLESAFQSIGIWQEPGGRPREIQLAPDSHAIHFELVVKRESQVTLDGRGNRAAEVFRLKVPKQAPAFRSIVLHDPPAWAPSLYRAAVG